MPNTIITTGLITQTCNRPNKIQTGYRVLNPVIKNTWTTKQPDDVSNNTGTITHNDSPIASGCDRRWWVRWWVPSCWGWLGEGFCWRVVAWREKLTMFSWGRGTWGSAKVMSFRADCSSAFLSNEIFIPVWTTEFWIKKRTLTRDARAHLYTHFLTPIFRHVHKENPQ